MRKMAVTLGLVCVLLTACGGQREPASLSPEGERSARNQEAPVPGGEEKNAEDSSEGFSGEDASVPFPEEGDPGSEENPEPEKGPETSGREEQEAPDTGNPGGKAEGTSEEQFMRAAGVEESEIQLFMRDDFDGDGTEEAFVITGGEVDYDYAEAGITEGSIWFFRDGVCRKLRDSGGLGFGLDAGVMELKDRRYILFEDYYVTSALTCVFEEKEGEVSECEFSGLGDLYWTAGEDTFRITDSSYDSYYDAGTGQMMGHSWKNYYFYYDDESDSVREYGGTEATVEEIEKLAGQKLPEMEQMVREEEIDSIYCRGNGLVHINYHRTDESGSVEYLHKNLDLTSLAWVNDYGEESEEECGGTYLAALIPGIATWPELP